MPFIDTSPATYANKLFEGTIQDDFENLLKAGDPNWSVVLRFTKIAYDANLINPNPGVIWKPESSVHIWAARHYIYKNSSTGRMFGLAIAGAFSEYYGFLPEMPVNSTNQADSAPFGAWVMDKFDEIRLVSALHFYMLENLPSNISDDDMIVMPWDKSSLNRGVLDAEVTGAYWVRLFPSSDLHSFAIYENDPAVRQSPITQALIRAPIYEDYFSEQYHVTQNDTNWWYDSEVRVQGWIDEEGFFVVMQADNAPAFQYNIVPSVPLYYGPLDPLETGDLAVALFAGSAAPVKYVDGSTDVNNFYTTSSVLQPFTRERLIIINEISKFDLDNPAKTSPPYSRTILPILKSYPSHPSNGIDTVMVHKGKFGARYQAYYLSWNTSTDAIPPDRRTDDGREYPRAWNHLQSEEYKYQFNPSRYTGKVHTSKIYVIHPEEGARGSLRKAIGFSSIGFTAQRLRVPDQSMYCANSKHNVYKYFLLDGVSPLTKRPGTVYRPMGLGIYETDYIPSV